MKLTDAELRTMLDEGVGTGAWPLVRPLAEEVLRLRALLGSTVDWLPDGRFKLRKEIQEALRDAD